MSRSKIIVINGLPGLGKTTLARNLAAKLSLPCIIKDEIKELLHDSLGGGDKEWLRKLGGASFPIIYYFWEELVKSGQSAVIEGVFWTDYDFEPFSRLTKAYDFDLIQLDCQAPIDIAAQRFSKRYQSGNRHAAHPDDHDLDEYKRRFGSRDYFIDVPSRHIVVDMSDFNKIDLDEIIARITS